jgi:hypothetical protein
MAHFEVPNGFHYLRNGNTFAWNTTDGGIGTISQYKFQVGSQPNYWNIFDGSWKPGGGPGRYTDTVGGLPGTGTLYVRAQYRRNGQTYRTSPVPFSCRP